MGGKKGDKAKGKQQQETEAAEGPVDDAEKAVMEKILQLSTESEDNKLSDADSKALARAQKAAMKDMKKIIESDCPAEEKLDSVQSKFTTLLAEHKKVERDLLINTRKLEKCTKDKDHAQQEATKLAAVKGKLETLCRELQKQNKAVIDDSRRVQEEEHNKRSELSNKFQETIKDVTVKLDAQGDDRIKQFQENDALREKLKKLRRAVRTARAAFCPPNQNQGPRGTIVGGQIEAPDRARRPGISQAAGLQAGTRGESQD